MKNNQLINCSASEIVSKLQSERVQPGQVLECLQDHYSRVEPQINAFDSVRLEALTINKGALAGLPISIKDQFAVKGMLRNIGLDKARNSNADYNAPIVQQLIDAGATIFGKTSLPPYAMDFQTYNQRAGRTNNPWNIELTPGGSSGGGAAAVASGMSYVDIGSDLSGSLRLPAAFCGVFSLLPGDGTLDSTGMLPDGGKLRHFARPGPIARSVDDLELIWSVLSGKTPEYETQDSFKLGMLDLDSEGILLQQEIRKSISEFEVKAHTNGIWIDHLPLQSLFRSETYQAFGEIMGYETGALIPAPARWLMRKLSRDALRRSPDFLTPVFSGYRRNKSEYLQAIKTREQIQRNFDEETRDYDAIMLPVCPVQAFKHRNADSEQFGSRDYLEPFDVEGAKIGYLDCLTKYTVPVGFLGLPVITIPLGLDQNNLPVGVQLVGRKDGENRLLYIARRIDSLTPRLENSYIRGK